MSNNALHEWNSHQRMNIRDGQFMSYHLTSFFTGPTFCFQLQAIKWCHGVMPCQVMYITCGKQCHDHFWHAKAIARCFYLTVSLGGYLLGMQDSLWGNIKKLLKFFSWYWPWRMKKYSSPEHEKRNDFKRTTMYQRLIWGSHPSPALKLFFRELKFILFQLNFPKVYRIGLQYTIFSTNKYLY